MGKSWRTATGQAVLALPLLLPLVACAGRAVPPDTVAGTSGSTARNFDEQEKINRRQAEEEARRLLGLAQLPPGAVALPSAPAALARSAVGTPNVSSYISLARYWRVPMPFAALDEYVRQHGPAGMVVEGDGTPLQDGVIIAHGYSWRDVHPRGSARESPPGGKLEISAAPVKGSSAASYLRIDAISFWLDPHPIRDSTGGFRLRLETGQGCPAGGRGFAGVRNDASDDLDSALGPSDSPASGRLCVYSDEGFELLRQQALSRAEAAQVATAASSVPLAHPNDVVMHCPAQPGSTIVAVLSYPNRSAVDLLIRTGGCQSASNGHVVAPQSQGLAGLVDLVSRLAG